MHTLSPETRASATDGTSTVSPVQVPEARRILGLGPDAVIDASTVRTAYRRLIRRVHPDVSAHPDAAGRSARLIQAYDVLSEVLAEQPGPTAAGTPASTGTRSAGRRSAPSRPPGPSTRPGTPLRGDRSEDGVRPSPTIRLLEDQSISVAAPADETMAFLLDAAHDLGEISYLDPTAGLVEVVVEFVEAPTSSVLFSLQGRGDGTTEVFCTVEPLSGGTAPPADAVTRLVAETLRNHRS